MSVVAARFAFVAGAGLVAAELARAGGGPAWVDQGAREWNQPRGGPRCDGACDVAPITKAPKEVWRFAQATNLCEPVCWGGTVFVVGTRKGEARLFALDLATGKTLVPAIKVDASPPVHLAVWNGNVAVLSHKQLACYRYRGRFDLAREKPIEGAWDAAPSVFDDYLFAAEGSKRLACIAMDTGEQVATTTLGCGQPCVIPGDAPGKARIACIGYESFSGQSAVVELAIEGLKTKATAFQKPVQHWMLPLMGDAPDASASFVGRLAGPTSDADAWFLFTAARIRAEGGGAMRSAVLPRHLAPIEVEPALWRDAACGFGAKSELVRFASDGKAGLVVPPGEPLPKGIRAGRGTRAGDVAYFENWAVDLESRRILWIAPELESCSALLPVADGRALYVDAGGALVCVGDDVARSSASASAPRARATAPGSGDGVVLADGTRVAGKVTRSPDGGASVEADGKTTAFARAKIAFVESGGVVERVGEEYPLFVACWSALLPDHLRGLEGAFDGYVEGGFVDDGQRLLAELRELGQDPARRAACEKKLSGRKRNDHPGAQVQRVPLATVETKARERTIDASIAAARWCRDHGASRAASALLARAERVSPGAPSVAALARELLPAGFPKSADASSPARWSAIVDAILPIDGEAAPPDGLGTTKRKKPWDEGALVLRSRNLLLLSREEDPRIVGGCLRDGERALRALGLLLGAPKGGDQPLEVRLHGDRAQYVEDRSSGRRAEEWTAGYYSPMQNVSFFYVPRGSDLDPLERDLSHVLVHELVHHWISARWLGDATRPAFGAPDRPGYWIVEGFARFVEDQVAQSDASGDARFDDATVQSIDAGARLRERERLLPLAEFLDLSQMGFAKLKTEPIDVMRLSSEVATRVVTEKIVFYEEAASLVFFLMNRGDAETREKLVAYLRDWYASKLEPKSWERLGFADASALEQEYLAFLKAR